MIDWCPFAIEHWRAIEGKGGFGAEPKSVLAEFSWTGFEAGMPICCGGISSIAGNIAQAWARVGGIPPAGRIAVARRVRATVLGARAQGWRLVTCIDADDRALMRWITWLGFDPKQKYWICHHG